MRAATKRNVAVWLDERDRVDARLTRRLALLGWTEVELDKLTSGVDFRDILRSDKAVPR